MLSAGVRSSIKKLSNMRATTKVYLAGALPVFFLLLVGVIALTNMQRMHQTQQWVDHRQAVIQSAGDIMRAAVDMETGMRGYLLAGSEQFLDPYRWGSANIFQNLRVLCQTVSDDPVQLARLEEAADVLRTWQNEVAEEQIQLRRAIGDAPTMNDLARVIAEGHGKLHFDGFRKLIAEFVDMEIDLLNERQERFAHLLMRQGVGDAETLNALDWVSHTHNVILEANLILSAAVNMETGMRGFLLSGDEVFLEPYEIGRKSFSERVQALSKTVSDNPVQVERLEQIEDAVGTWRMSLMEPVLSLRRQIGTAKTMDDMADLVGQAKGKAHFDEFRRIMNTFVAEERRLMVESRAANEAMQKLSSYLIVGSVAAAVIVGGVISWLIGLDMLRAIRELIASMKRLTRRNYDARVYQLYRHDEFGAMARSLDLLRRDLADGQNSVQASLQSMRRAQEEAEAANEAKGQFLANMSHEIRTPMNGIVGMTEYLMTKEHREDQREALEVIRTSGAALVRIINDILDFSKLESDRLEIVPETFELDDMIYSLVGLVKHGLDKPAVTFGVELSERTPITLNLDAKRLRQILLNVVGNAYKFTERGSVVVAADFDGDQLILNISDSGIGIPADKMPTVFEAFRQIDNTRTRKHDGTGLGLAITKKLVETMGGTIALKSEPDVGTKFTIKLPAKAVMMHSTTLTSCRVVLVGPDPVAKAFWLQRFQRLGADAHVFSPNDADAPQMPPGFVPTEVVLVKAEPTDETLVHSFGASVRLFCAAGQAPGPSQAIGLDALMTNRAIVAKFSPEEQPAPVTIVRDQKLRVLAAEDNRTNQLILKKLFSNSDIDLEICANGQEALVALQCEHEYDVVLMDISMPVVGGVEATKRLRHWERAKSKPSVPVVALTANVSQEDQEGYARAGMNAFMPKPFDKDALVQTIFDLSERSGQLAH